MVVWARFENKLKDCKLAGIPDTYITKWKIARKIHYLLEERNEKEMNNAKRNAMKNSKTLNVERR